MENYKKLIEELLAKARAIDEKATPGPWMWEIRTGIHDCKLMTAHSGQYYVMDFERWGMQDACPRFQVYERYAGPVAERGSKGMVRSDKLSKSYPGKEHHRGFDDYIDHPDATFIVEARTLLPELISAVETLTAQLAEKEKQIADLETQHRVEYCERAGYDCQVRGQLTAAVSDLEHLMTATQSAEACYVCANDHDHLVCGSNFTGCRPKWRGAQETGEGGG